MKDIKGCLLHETDEWCTPSKLYNAFMVHGYLLVHILPKANLPLYYVLTMEDYITQVIYGKR